MKLVRIGLAIVVSLVLVCLFPCPLQADTDHGEVDLTATAALTISDVSASSVGYYGGTISWKTNGDATSQVFYDTIGHDNTVDYARQTDEDTGLVSEHSVALTGLASSTTYHYRVRSTIPENDLVAISDDYTFRTSAPPAGGGVPPPPIPPAPPPGTTDVRGMVTTAGVFLEPVTATSEDELCTLTIPEGTVGLTEELEPLTEITILIMDEPPPPPEAAHIVGLAYDFQPSGATFEPPITLEYTYDPADIPEGIAEEDLVVAYYDEAAAEWVELDCVVDTENNTVTASVSHFTAFAIIARIAPAPPAPALFSVSNLSVKPAEVELKEAVTIAVSVANTGGTEGSYTVVLKVNGVKEAEKKVTIAAGSSEIVSFSVTREESGSYSVTIDGLSASFAVVAPEEEVVPPEEEEVVPKVAPVNWPLIGGIIAAVVVVLGLIIFFLVRRRAQVTKQ